MSQKKFLKDISASTIQIGVTQIANLVIFYLISKYISKEEFGFYNWGVALCSTIITILSFGMDLVYVKRVASGIKEEITIGIHFFHTLFTGIVLTVISLIITTLFPDIIQMKQLFVLILISQVTYSISNSLKLALNGFEQYKNLAYISININLIKVILIIILFFISKLTMNNILIIYISTYLLEFLNCRFYLNKISNLKIKPIIIISEYKELLKESLPQLGTVILSTSSVRLDILLMGILATTIQTAEYSFSLKMIQISGLPLLIIAPILLTRFSKIFSQEIINKETISKLNELLKIEMIIAVLIPLSMAIIWSDLFDKITNNKYGSVNYYSYIIMAIGIPIHYAINFFWTIAFSLGQLKKILIITIIGTSINVLLNIILIELFAGEGAALADLLTSVVSFILYLRLIKRNNFKINFIIPFISIFNGIISLIICNQFKIHEIFKLIITICIFMILSYITKQINFKYIIKQFVK